MELHSPSEDSPPLRRKTNAFKSIAIWNAGCRWHYMLNYILSFYTSLAEHNTSVREHAPGKWLINLTLLLSIWTENRRWVPKHWKSHMRRADYKAARCIVVGTVFGKSARMSQHKTSYMQKKSKLFSTFNVSKLNSINQLSERVHWTKYHTFTLI